MEKYIPIEKRSKKEKQALAKARRGSWGALNPVTRKPANPKAYNRKKSRHEEEFFDGGICFSAAASSIIAHLPLIAV